MTETTTARYTPGPWTAWRHKGDVWVSPVSDLHDPIVEIETWDEEREGWQELNLVIEANACLIAAAPELADALEALAWEVEALVIDAVIPRPNKSSAYTAAHALLARIGHADGAEAGKG